MSTCIEIDHPTYFRPLVYCPGSCKYDTDNVDEIGNKNNVRPTEPSRKKYGEYNQRDVNGKSDKAVVSQSLQQVDGHGRDYIISERDGEDGRGDALLNKDICQYMTYVLLM